MRYMIRTFDGLPEPVPVETFHRFAAYCAAEEVPVLFLESPDDDPDPVTMALISS